MLCTIAAAKKADDDKVLLLHLFALTLLNLVVCDAHWPGVMSAKLQVANLPLHVISTPPCRSSAHKLLVNVALTLLLLLHFHCYIVVLNYNVY